MSSNKVLGISHHYEAMEFWCGAYEQQLIEDGYDYVEKFYVFKEYL